MSIPNCPSCGGERRRQPSGHLYCSPCARAESRRRYNERKDDPAFRALNVERACRWQQEQRSDPEKHAKIKARYRRYTSERRQADPEYAEKGRAANRAYKKRARARASERERLRRTLVEDAFVEHVEPLVLLEREDGRCGICGQDLDPFDFQVDHVIPLSRGGEHSYANTQPAHPLCNQRKYNKVAL